MRMVPEWSLTWPISSRQGMFGYGSTSNCWLAVGASHTSDWTLFGEGAGFRLALSGPTLNHEPSPANQLIWSSTWIENSFSFSKNGRPFELALHNRVPALQLRLSTQRRARSKASELNNKLSTREIDRVSSLRHILCMYVPTHT